MAHKNNTPEVVCERVSTGNKGLILLSVAFMAIFLIPSVSAWVLPSSSYDSKTQTYTLSALAGAWKIADVKLLDNTDYCEINCNSTRLYTFYDDVLPNEYEMLFYSIGGEDTPLDYTNKMITYTGDLKSDIDIKEAIAKEHFLDVDLSKTSFENGKSYIVITSGKKWRYDNMDWIENFDGFVMEKFAWWSGVANAYEQTVNNSLVNYTTAGGPGTPEKSFDGSFSTSSGGVGVQYWYNYSNINKSANVSLNVRVSGVATFTSECWNGSEYVGMGGSYTSGDTYESRGINASCLRYGTIGFHHSGEATFYETKLVWYNIATNITTTLNSPEDNLNSTSASQEFNCSANMTNNVVLKNITLYLWNSTTAYSTYNKSLSGTTINSTIFSLTNMAESMYYWNCRSVDTSGANTSWGDANRTLQVNYAKIGRCNATYTKPAINFTIWDEENNNQTNASIENLLARYWTDGSYYQTFSYNSGGVSTNSNYTFCIWPNYTSILNLNYNISYKQGTDYPQREMAAQTANLTNSSVTEKKLYLLGVLDGLYVTFQVINPSLLPLNDVSITLSRLIGGIITVVGEGITDSSGISTLWLNPLYSHTITAIKSGYTTYSSSVTPTQSQYTISMSSLTTANITDTISGINYTMIPAGGQLNKSTAYTFAFFISDSNSNLDGYGFNLTNSSGYIFYQATGALVSGGTLSESIDTGLNSTFVMRAYYIVDGKTSLINGQWAIYNMTSDQYSINKIFTDLKTYKEAGMFGINDFSLLLILFIIIFISTGIMCYNFGIYSPGAISVMIFVEVFLLDSVFRVFPSQLNYFPSIFMFIIMIAMIFKEYTSY